MSKEKKITILKDIVHNYIKITPIEKIMTSHPLFQRLRFIGQNSMAYYTYPSNHSTRFLHSLGVMHLGGEMFKRALENADSTDLKLFLKEAEDFVTKYAGKTKSIEDFLLSWNNVLGNVSGFNYISEDEEHKIILEPKHYFFINVLWQSVRLASAVHDIGHFPISHIFEYALKNYAAEFGTSNNKGSTKVQPELENISNEYKKIVAENEEDINNIDELELHEMQGIIQLKNIYAKSNNGTPTRVKNDLDDIAVLCFNIGKDVFIKNKIESKSNKLLNCLYTIISGDLDADRLDYCIRDAINSGVELGAIDISRIIHNLKLKVYKDTGKMEIVVKPNALSAIEEFFHQRYQLYKYVLYHHNVVRFNSLMQLIIINILREIDSPNSIIEPIYSKYKFWDENNSVRKLLPMNYEYYDDYWMRTFLTDIYYSLKDNNQAQENPKYRNITLQLKTLLYRETNNIHSLNKKETDTNQFIEDLRDKITAINNNSYSDIEIVKFINDLFKGPNKVQTLRELREELDIIGVQLVYDDCKAKILDKPTVDNTTKKLDFVNGKFLKVMYNIKGGVKFNSVFHSSKYLKSLEKVEAETIIPDLSFLSLNIESDKSKCDQCREIVLNYIQKNINY
jgi:HD superfamily phosphohydrolase